MSILSFAFSFFNKQEPDHEDLRLFRRVNDGMIHPETKRLYFFPFKQRFLERWGNKHGTVLQIINNECRACCGAGDCYYENDIPCPDCKGSGIYDRGYILHTQWDLRGEIYLTPFAFFRSHGAAWGYIAANNITITSRIQGRVERDFFYAAEEFFKLMKHFDKCTFLELQYHTLKRYTYKAFRNWWHGIRSIYSQGIVYHDNLPF